MSDKQLATTQSTLATARGVQLTSYAEMKEFARDVANSGLAPNGLKTPEAIIVALQHGLELGLSPSQALQSIAVINGRPTIFGDAALALVKAHPECEDVIETIEKNGDDTTAVCTVQRRGKVPVVRKFSVAMAKKAQLWGKSGPWSTYPARMLAMRARSWALRDSFPDALRGVAVREEQQDVQTEKIANAREVAPKVIFPDEAEHPQLAAPVQEQSPYVDGGDTEPDTGEEREADGSFKF